MTGVACNVRVVWYRPLPGRRSKLTRLTEPTESQIGRVPNSKQTNTGAA